MDYKSKNLQFIGDIDADTLDGKHASEFSEVNHIHDQYTQHDGIVITLLSSNWVDKIQTVSVTGVTTTNTIIVSSSPDSFSLYGSSKVRCVSQSTNSLTFECDTIPSTNLTINVVILN